MDGVKADTAEEHHVRQAEDEGCLVLGDIVNKHQRLPLEDASERDLDHRRDGAQESADARPWTPATTGFVCRLNWSKEKNSVYC